MSMLSGEKILVTGPASQVGLPVARALAANNEVHGLARFSKREDREQLEKLGVRCIALDLADDSFDAVPNDFTVVLHFAVVKSGKFEYDLAANAEGTGRLMAHCRRARAFLHCSSGGVYRHQGPEHPAKEGDPFGDNHRLLMPTYSICKIAAETMARFAARQWRLPTTIARLSVPYGDNHRLLLPTYSICKIAAETMARFAARQWRLPTTIARLSVPYGDNGGWPWFHLVMMRAGQPIPLHPERPNLFNPLHEDDYLEQIPRLLEIASVPATLVNWGGSEPVSVEEWCAYISELTGLESRFETTERTVGALPLDLTRMHELLGRTRVPWREGIRRMIEARAPELLA
jgi:UDP-glucuronate 4-epimerase